jgi:hypothetical protein
MTQPVTRALLIQTNKFTPYLQQTPADPPPQAQVSADQEQTLIQNHKHYKLNPKHTLKRGGQISFQKPADTHKAATTTLPTLINQHRHNPTNSHTASKSTHNTNITDQFPIVTNLQTNTAINITNSSSFANPHKASIDLHQPNSKPHPTQTNQQPNQPVRNTVTQQLKHNTRTRSQHKHQNSRRIHHHISRCSN